MAVEFWKAEFLDHETKQKTSACVQQRKTFAFYDQVKTEFQTPMRDRDKHKTCTGVSQFRCRDSSFGSETATAAPKLKPALHPHPKRGLGSTYTFPNFILFLNSKLPPSVKLFCTPLPLIALLVLLCCITTHWGLLWVLQMTPSVRWQTTCPPPPPPPGHNCTTPNIPMAMGVGRSVHLSKESSCSKYTLAQSSLAQHHRLIILLLLLLVYFCCGCVCAFLAVVWQRSSAMSAVNYS